MALYLQVKVREHSDTKPLQHGAAGAEHERDGCASGRLTGHACCVGHGVSGL